MKNCNNKQSEAVRSEIVFLVEEAPEGGFIARALGYSVFTEADNWEKLKAAIQDAISCHFEDGQKPEWQVSYRGVAGDSLNR